MLIKCPECELQISDKAVSCPHCGLPMKSKRPANSRPRRRRLPSGFGWITEVKYHKLHKPFRVMVAAGKKPDGKYNMKLLKPEAYFETYNEAYQALVEYNKSPYDLDTSITVGELYAKWSKEYFQKLSSDSSVRTIKAAWAKCSEISNLNAKSLRPRHIKGVMETIESPNIKNRVKSMFNLMLDYAVEYDIVEKNYARSFDVETVEAQTEHITFTNEEMEILWKNQNISVVQLILIQCYTGFRPQELCKIEKENIKEDHIIGGMKTDAGKNRIVPIHEKIKGLVAVALPVDLTYDKYYKEFKKVIATLGLNNDHRPHDPRKHFITQAKKYNVDEYAIKRIVGHAIPDITESVYTERDLEWLVNEVNKIQ